MFRWKCRIRFSQPSWNFNKTQEFFAHSPKANFLKKHPWRNVFVVSVVLDNFISLLTIVLKIYHLSSKCFVSKSEQIQKIRECFKKTRLKSFLGTVKKVLTTLPETFRQKPENVSVTVLQYYEVNLLSKEYLPQTDSLDA